MWRELFLELEIPYSKSQLKNATSPLKLDKNF